MAARIEDYLISDLQRYSGKWPLQ